MTYRPPVKTSDFGTKGLAKVSLNSPDRTKATKAKVTFYNDDGTVGKQYVVAIKDCSDEVKGYICSGEFVVNMSKDGDKIFSMYPYNGMFEGKVTGFSAKKDQPPSPYTYSGKDQKGKTYTYLFFVANIEIISPPEFKGMHVPCFLRYNFEETEQDVNGTIRKVARYSTTMKSKHTLFLDEYMGATKSWEAGPIPYSDNILPKLEQRALRAAASFKFLVKKGFLSDFYQETTFTPAKPDEAFEGADFDAENLTDDPTEDTTGDKFE